MKVKIMDASLIRRYGGAIVEMNDSVAFKLQAEGKVKIIEAPVEPEIFNATDSVLVFASEKEETPKNKINKRIPAADEPIFPQINV
jgi:hypothetical protein